MKKSRFIASILSLSVGITSFSIIPMETFAENGIIKLSESEQITDIYKIYKILSEGLADNEYVKKVLDNEFITRDYSLRFRLMNMNFANGLRNILTKYHLSLNDDDVKKIVPTLFDFFNIF